MGDCASGEDTADCLSSKHVFIICPDRYASATAGLCEYIRCAGPSLQLCNDCCLVVVSDRETELTLDALPSFFSMTLL